MDALEDTQSSLGVCCCCLAEGSYKDMMRPYTWIGQDEIYSTMLIDCFGIDITSLEVAPWLDSKRLICELCIARLREASSFKTQVEQAQKTYVDRLKTFNFRDITKPDLMAPAVKLEQLDDSEVDHYNDLVDDFAVDDDMSDILPAVTSQTYADESNKVHRDRRSISRYHKLKLQSDSVHNSLRNIDIKTQKDYSEAQKKKSSKSIDSKDANLANRTATAKRDIATILEYTNLYPFQWIKNRYSCFVCKEQYSIREDLRAHMESHDRKTILASVKYLTRLKIDISVVKCVACCLQLANFDELKNHLLTEHSKIIYDQSHALLLLFKLDKDNKLLCRICGAVYDNFPMLNQHMNVHYKNCICETCGKSFMSKARLRLHFKSHTVGEFPCKLCDEVFDIEAKRDCHTATVHRKGLRYTCPQCGVRCRSYRARSKHLLETHNEQLRKFHCKLCPKVFMSSESRSFHVRKNHLNERKFECVECQTKFFALHELKKHEVKHSGARVHECNVCHKAYQRLFTLREHMKIHTNEKRFVCTVCGKAFTQKCTLKGHLKVHERPNVDSKVTVCS